MLTYAYWQRVFGGDPAVVGQILDLTVKKALIVGVLAPGSHYATTRKQDFYVNYAANDHYMGASMQDERRHRMTDVYARLAPGATVGAAQAELRQIAARLHDGQPGGLSEVARLRHGRDAVEGRTDGQGAADADDPAGHDGLRADHRLRERRQPDAHAARAARARDGDSRRARRARRAARRQLLAENLVLSIVGGVLGLGLAVAGSIC